MKAKVNVLVHARGFETTLLVIILLAGDMLPDQAGRCEISRAGLPTCEFARALPKRDPTEEIKGVARCRSELSRLTASPDESSRRRLQAAL